MDEASICPRCGSRLLSDLDERYCLTCGWRSNTPVSPPEPPPRRIRPGNYARGERNGNAKLTDAEVAAIRERAASGAVYREIAESFGVSVRHVGNVVRRDLRAHAD